MLGLGVMDVPNHRSSHVVATPRGGGLACAIGIAVAAVFAAVSGRVVPWPALLGAGVLAVVGFIDDREPMAPKPRLLSQFATGAVSGLLIGGPVLAVVGLLLTPLLVNVVNFMDGINGISGMTMGVWGAAALVNGVRADAPGFAVLGVLALGGALGFLPWNVPVARLFLGDVGSYLFGGLVSLATLVGLHEGVNAYAAVAPLMIYVADVLATLLRRWWWGAKLTQAHREHVYQRVVGEAGLRHWHVSLCVALISGLCAAVWAFTPFVLAVTVTVLLVAAYILAPRIIRRSLAPAESASRR